MPQPILKDEIGKLLLSLLVARKDSCTLHDLEKDYCENEGRRIPYMDYGNLSLLDFLRSIPQYVNVFCKHGVYYVSPVVTAKTKHVSDLVSKQRPGKKGTPTGLKKSRLSRYFTQVREPKPFIPNTLQNKVAEILTANPNGVKQDEIIQCLHGSSAIPTPVDSNNIDEYVSAMSSIAHMRNSRIYPNKSLHLTNMSEQQHVPSTSTNAIPPSMGSTHFRPNVQRAAVAYPAGYEDEDDCNSEDDFDDSPVDNGNEYRASNNNQSQQHVINEHKTRISSAEFIMRVRQQQNHSWFNTVRNNHTKNYCNDTGFEGNCDINNESDRDSDDESPRYIINPRIKTRLQQLIQKHPEGIWCADLLQKYLEEYKVELDYTDLGFSSVSEFASNSNLQDIFHCVRYKRLGDFKLYDATKPVPERLVGPEIDPNSSDWEERVVDDVDADPLQMTLESDFPSKLIPKEVLNYGESVGQEKIPDFLDATEYLEVIAAEVFSPSLFWIHLRKKKAKLDQLMDSLNTFYTQEADRYTIPHVILEKGLNCACQYDNLWHRAIIKTVKPDGDVTLIFYDFGTVKTFPPEAVRFLHRDFSNLPAQAIPCGLYNVKPLNADAWTRGVSSEFWNRIYEIPLIAIIAKIDKQTNSMLVSLVDTQEEEDLHINDWMVQMTYAEFGSMVRSRPSNFVYRHYLICVKYRYNERKKRNRSRKSARLNSVASAANLNHPISEHGAQAKIETASALEKVLTNCEVPSTLVNVLMTARGCSSIDIPAPQSNSSSRISQLRQIIESQKSLGDSEKCVEDTEIKSQVQFEPIYAVGKNMKESQVESVTAYTYPPQHSAKSLDSSNSENHSEIQINIPTKSLGSSDSKKSSGIKNDNTSTKSSGIKNSENTSGIRINTSEKQVSTDELEYCGNFRSFHGGHGFMQPIDWSKLRNAVQHKSENEKPEKHTKSSVLSQPYKEPTVKFESELQTNKRNEPSQESLPCSAVFDVQMSKVKSIDTLAKKKILPLQDWYINAMKSNKDYYKNAHGERLWWSPDGNIQHNSGVMNHELQRRKNLDKSDINAMEIYASPEIFKMLKVKRSTNKVDNSIRTDVSDADLRFITHLTFKPESREKISNSSQNDKPKVSTFRNNRFAEIKSFLDRKKTQNLSSSSSTISATTVSSSNMSDSSSISGHRISSIRKASQAFSSSFHYQPKRNTLGIVDNRSSETGSSLSSENFKKVDKSPECHGVTQDRDLNKLSEKFNVTQNEEKCSNVGKSTALQDNLEANATCNEISIKTSGLPECHSVTQDLNKSSEKFDVTQNEEKSSNVGESIALQDNFKENASCNKISFKTSGLLDPSHESLNIMDEKKTCHTITKNKDLRSNNVITFASVLKKRIEVMDKQNQSDSHSELDSDDSSHSCHNSEEKPRQVALPKAKVELDQEVECSQLNDKETPIISQNIVLYDCCNIKEQSLVPINSTANQDNNEQLETDYLQNKTEFFSPHVDDLNLTSDSDEWDVNGDWLDFMKGKADTMAHKVQKLQISDKMSEAAKVIELTDDHMINSYAKMENFRAEHKTESTHTTIFSEMSDILSHDGTTHSHFPRNESIENIRPDSIECSNSASGRKISDNCISSVELKIMGIKMQVFDKQQNEFIDSITNGSDNQNAIQKNNSASTEPIIKATNYPEHKSGSDVMSKTKSMREMLMNLKSKSNPNQINPNSESADMTSESQASASQSAKSADMDLEINTSDDDEIFKDVSSESGMSANLSDSSSSYRGSLLRLLRHDIRDSKDKSKVLQPMASHKSSSVSSQHRNIDFKSQALSSDDVEQPSTSSKQFSIVSRLKSEQLSAKSQIIDQEIQNVHLFNSEAVGENTLCFDESSTSTTSLSTSLLNKMLRIFD